MTTTKTMESDENFNYDEVVEMEDEEGHLCPGPIPRKKRPIVVPSTQQSTQQG